MKAIKYIIPFLFLFLGCKPSYLIQKTIELDSKKNQYISTQLITKEVSNYELSASITFKESYRSEKTGWAGFLLNTNANNGLHGKDKGYLFFIRENGYIGLSSEPFSKEIILTKYLRSLEFGKKIDIKIEKNNSQLKVAINGKEHFNVPSLLHQGKYISANAGGTSVSIKINSFKEL